MADGDQRAARKVPLANRIARDVVIPVGAVVMVFLGVCSIGVFVRLLQPGADGSPVFPWMFGVLGSLLMFVGCWGIVHWQLERERLRSPYRGDVSPRGSGMA